MAIDKINILDVEVSVLNLDSATRAILGAIEKKEKGYVCVTSVHGVVEANEDKSFREVLNDAFLCTPDGVPLVWVGRGVYGREEMSRVYGPDLMWELMRAGEKRAIRHFLYGGKEGVAEKLKERLLQHFPEAEIVGTYCPPFRPLTEEERKDVTARVAECRPDIIWVGLSTPKQERFMAEHLPELDTTMMIGVGAAFDFYTDAVRQAPKWMQQNGLEWLYRIYQEPRRLWPRYRHINPRFIFLIARQILGRRNKSD